jgi:hypothetical protein
MPLGRNGDTIMELTSLFELLNKNISQLFRHIIPGFLILGGLYLAHPFLYNGINISISWHLLLLAIAAIVLGNTWFVFHRYGVHQAVDLLMYLLGRKGPIPSKRKLLILTPYCDDLANHIIKTFTTSPEKEKIHDHVTLRASSMHLMYIASELLIFIGFSNDSNSFIAINSLSIRFIIIGIIGFIVTMVQNIINRRIDWLVQQ